MAEVLAPTALSADQDVGPSGRLHFQDLARLPAHQLYALLSPERRRGIQDLVGRLMSTQSQLGVISTVVEDLCGWINALGIPLDRYGSSTEVLTPEHDAIGRLWTRERGVRENVYVQPAGQDETYESSPYFRAAKTKTWVELWLPETSDDLFRIIPELKGDGYTHYLCIPFLLSNGGNGWITMATRNAEGFSRQDVASIMIMAPAIERLIDGRVGWMTLDLLLRTYVGDEPHRAILDGNVKRGQVSTIRSAILFADMRDSTGQTADLSAAEAVRLFNDFFDTLVPPIENRHGEVLKYLGDGLLAIFRAEAGEDVEAAARANAAAHEMIDNLARFNADRPERRPIETGIALHFGEVAYGNVGSGQRLDFTVIGRDVSLASRIGHMNAPLGQPVLMSEAFAQRLRQPVEALGSYPARGFVAPVAVFRPSCA